MDPKPISKTIKLRIPYERLFLLMGFLFLLFSLLIVRFYKIQIIEHDRWVKQALSQHQFVASIPFMRGSFYSNVSIKKGHPEEPQALVIDVPKFHLWIDPEAISLDLKPEMIDFLSKKCKACPAEIEKIRASFYKKSHARKIASWLDREERKEIEEWWRFFSSRHKIVKNALFFSSEFKRSYPFGKLLGSILHTVREEKDPKTHQAIPTGGLELAFHSYLQGKPGKKLITRSPLHSLDVGKILEPVENGADIYLTINHYLQAIVEKELKKGVIAAKAKGGWAVMMDPWTGQIWALAQEPGFDPSRYKDYFNDPKLQECTRVKALTDCYEPGSIFKPITMAICMKANEELLQKGKAPLFSPEEKIACSNGWFPGRASPLKDARVHHYLNMDMALQKSSNIYVAKLAQRLVETMGERWYHQALGEYFGFGQKTQVELPGENAGLVPTPGKCHANGRLEWSLPTPYSLAMGHNILVNAIQMVRAYAVFANGGTLVQPHLVQKIVKNQEVILDEGSLYLKKMDHEGKKEDFSSLDFSQDGLIARGKRVFSPQICKRVVESLKYVTKEGGTCKRADVMGYTEVGKSGTAEKIIDGIYSKDHNISSFLGFAPASYPRFVLLVSLDEPEKKWIPGVGKHQFGGVCAAPIFREIATETLSYLGVTPDDPYGYLPGDPRRDIKKADWLVQVQKLKDLYDEWNVGKK